MVVLEYLPFSFKKKMKLRQNKRTWQREITSRIETYEDKNKVTLSRGDSESWILVNGFSIREQPSWVEELVKHTQDVEFNPNINMETCLEGEVPPEIAAIYFQLPLKGNKTRRKQDLFGVASMLYLLSVRELIEESGPVINCLDLARRAEMRIPAEWQPILHYLDEDHTIKAMGISNIARAEGWFIPNYLLELASKEVLDEWGVPKTIIRYLTAGWVRIYAHPLEIIRDYNLKYLKMAYTCLETDSKGKKTNLTKVVLFASLQDKATGVEYQAGEFPFMGGDINQCEKAMKNRYGHLTNFKTLPNEYREQGKRGRI